MDHHYTINRRTATTTASATTTTTTAATMATATTSTATASIGIQGRGLRWTDAEPTKSPPGHLEGIHLRFQARESECRNVHSHLPPT